MWRWGVRLRLLVVLAAAVGAAVLVPAAFAHSSGLSVTAVCNTTTGKYDVTWKVGPTDYLSKTPKVSASNRSSIPLGTFITTQYTTFSESVSGSATSVSASITITWTGDGWMQDLSASKSLRGDCVPDTGSLKITKTLTGGPQGYTGPFAVAYDCGVGHAGVVSVSAGSFQTVTGIPLMASCLVSEPQLPSAPDGWSFGTPGISPDNGVVTITGKATPVEVTVANTLSRDQGYVKIVKVFDPKSSGFQGPFTVHYDCGSGDQSVALAGGASATVGPLDTGTSCSVSEPVLPSAPSGWSFGSPQVSGSPAVIVKSSAESPGVMVTVTNSITQNVKPVTPQPPVVPSTSDITVTKTATAVVELPQGGGTAPISYSIVVKNNGPAAAENVRVSDAAPAGVLFVSATPQKGSCTVSFDKLALDCAISSLAAGESVAIDASATVSSTGTKLNVVVVTTTTPETNTNNNSASASTIVTTQATPPKPKPKPKPNTCQVLIAAPKTVKANGTKQKLRVTVKRGTKGVRGAKVKITGPGIAKTVRTGKNGRTVVTIRPKKAGIVKVSIASGKACNNARIGAVGAFEPPVTG